MKPLDAISGLSFAILKLLIAVLSLGPCTFPAGSKRAIKSDSWKLAEGREQGFESIAFFTGFPK
jgi:hypothetical protein